MELTRGSAQLDSYTGLAVNNLGHAAKRVTHVVPRKVRPCAFAIARGWTACCGGSENTSLLVESAGSETPQVVARFSGQIGMRMCTCEICHRPAYPRIHRG